MVKTASHVVIVALSGMRQSELREMNVGCRVPPIEAGDPADNGKRIERHTSDETGTVLASAKRQNRGLESRRAEPSSVRMGHR
ncbi:hypothetical protein [Streptomyces sioyaensis]|uniref:hypothetical protein n=1 Tax=Streptomyces sioyaensis TaxID=67364 RepID=UPI003714BA28